jgi:maleylacetoacetate isomerase
MILYDYFRSSAAFRVRIAMNLKGLKPERRYVHLLRDENRLPEYRAINPQGFVPFLIDGDFRLSQSLAIIEYLDETHPEPPLMPPDALGRARVRALALDIACEIHPLNNMRVLRYLVRDLKVSEDDKNRWYRHWVETGLEAVERQLDDASSGRFCHGDAPTLADLALVPQIFNARRFECRLDHVPHVMRVFDECMKLPAFEQTQPSKCPDAE